MTILRRFLAGAGCALALCFLAAAARPAHADPAPDWEVEWRAASTSRGTVHALAATHGRAILAGARLAGDKGWLSGFSLADGQRTFASDVLGQHDDLATWSLVPRSADGGFYLCGTRTADYAFEGFVSRYGADGRRLWTVDTGDDALPQLAELSDDRVVVAIQLQRWTGQFWLNDGTRLSVLDAATGQLISRRDARNVTTLYELGATGGAVYLRGVSATTLLARFGADLAPGWTYSDLAATGMPRALAGGRLVFPANLYRPELGGSVALLVAVDAATGAERWRSEGQSVGSSMDEAVSVSVSADSVVFAGGDWRTTELFAVDPATGARRWRTELPFTPHATAIDDSRIYAVLADEDAETTSVRTFQRASGAAGWTQPFGETDSALLAVDGGRVVAALLEDYSSDRWFVRTFDGTSGAAAPITALMDNPMQGYAVNDAQGDVYAAASSVEDDAVVIYVRKHDRATGAVRWERRIEVAQGEWPDIAEPAGITIAPDGTLIAWAYAHNEPAEGSAIPHVGHSAMYALDPLTGATRWSRVRDGQMPFSPLPQVLAVAASASAVYVETAFGTDIEDDLPVYDVSIEAIALADGASKWFRQEFSSYFAIPQSLLATDDGLLVSGSRVASSVAGMALYAAADGSVTWSRATPGTLLENARFAQLDGSEDAIVATTTVSGSRRDVAVERFSAKTGVSRWLTTFGANNGIHDDPRALLVHGGEVFVAGRHDNLRTGKPFIARVDTASGATIWETTLLSGLEGHSSSQLTALPSGELGFTVRTLREASDGRCVVCTSHLVRVARDDGHVLGWHHAGSEVDTNYQRGNGYAYLEHNGNGDVALQRQAHRDGSRTMRVGAQDWGLFVAGGVQVSIAPAAGLDAVDGVGRAAFDVAITHDAAETVAGIVVQTQMPVGSRVFDTGCVVTGTGDCGARVNDGGAQRIITLAPGATAHLSLLVEILPLVPSGNPSLTVVAQMPWRFGTGLPAESLATTTVVPTALLSNGFE